MSVSELMSNILFRDKTPPIPEAKIPAAPAPETREDTGALVVTGADNVKDKRTSGKNKSAVSGSTSGGDILGNLGKGGLNV